MFTRRRALQALGAAATGVGAAAATGTALAPAAQAATVRSPISPVAAFLDTVGVNAHWNYPDTPYGYAYAAVREKLVASGIRHVRAETSRAADLATSGVRTTVLVDLDANGAGDPAAIVAGLAPLAASGAVVALEGPNESDLFWTRGDWRYRGAGFPSGPASWQADLYRAAKANPSTAALPVIGMSFGKTYWGGGHPFGTGSLAGTADWGNLHPYAGGNPYFDRFTYGGVKEYYRYADFPTVTLDRAPINLATYRPPFGALPMAVTEMGYSTWDLGQSESVQARYTLRTLLEFFRLGFKRTYLYELVDAFADDDGSDREAHFGLLRHDLSPKPAYTALTTMLMALRDVPAPAGTAPPEEVAVDVSVTPASGYDAAQVHHVALRKSDGTVVVAVWHEVSADDLSGLDASPKQAPRQLTHPSATVSVTFSSATGGTSAAVASRASRTTGQQISSTGVFQAKAIARREATSTMLIGDAVVLLTLPAR